MCNLALPSSSLNSAQSCRTPEDRDATTSSLSEPAAELGKQKQKDSWPRFARMPLPKGISLIGCMSKPLTQPGTLPLPVATCESWRTRSNMGYLGKVYAQHEAPTKFLINSQKYVQGLNYQICDAFLSTAPSNDFAGQRTQLSISWEFPLLLGFSTDFACSAMATANWSIYPLRST